MNRHQFTVATQIAIIAVIFVKSPVSLAGVFKCTGPDGSTTYQSKPCNSDTTQARIKLRTHSYSPSANSQSAESTGKSSNGTAPSVVLYSTSWCGYCKKIRKLFADNNIAYKEYDIEESAKAKREYDKLNGKGVPLTTIDGTLVRGFKRDRLLALAKPH